MPKQLLFIVLIFAALSCSKKDSEKKPTTCPVYQTIVADIATVTIKFKQKNGDAAVLSQLSVINKRTNEPVDRSMADYTYTVKGTYFIIDDMSLRKLSVKGDDILVTATDSASTQTKTATIKVAGGPDVCHIKKISGPDTVTFD